MEYNGWTLYDEVTLVIRNEEYHGIYDYPQAFVVNTKDKKQLEKALQWGTVTEYLRDENNEYIREASGKYVLKTLEPKVITIKNEGFQLELYNVAGASSQGGKLSFWNCLIEHEEHNIKCIIGIDSALLLKVLKQNSFENGRCLSKLSFARCSGGVGLVNKNMKEYEQAIKDGETKKALSRGKTTKYQLGHNYITLRQNDIYFGKLYNCFDIEEHFEPSSCTKQVSLEIFANSKNIARHILQPSYRYNKITKMSEFLNNVRESIKIQSEKISDTSYQIISSAEPFILDYTSYKQTTLPSRKSGDIQLEIDVDYDREVDDILIMIKEMVLKALDNGTRISVGTLEKMLVSTKPFEVSSLSELDREVIKKIMAMDNLKEQYGMGYTIIVSCDDICKPYLKDLL